MDAGLFGKRLKEVREAMDLTQMDLAKRSGLSQKAISSWELGQRVPLLTHAVTLAQALGVEVGELLEEPAKKPRKGKK